ncbi:hypothetical protein COCNU_scaffold002541G000010 [Cocos nucifera]|nr:hypothetical protein [Cocos nucifera]
MPSLPLYARHHHRIGSTHWGEEKGPYAISSTAYCHGPPSIDLCLRDHHWIWARHHRIGAPRSTLKASAVHMHHRCWIQRLYSTSPLPDTVAYATSSEGEDPTNLPCSYNLPGRLGRLCLHARVITHVPPLESMPPLSCDFPAREEERDRILDLGHPACEHHRRLPAETPLHVTLSHQMLVSVPVHRNQPQVPGIGG